jgi:hypothetical protein
MYLLTSSVLVAGGLQEWILKFKLKKGISILLTQNQNGYLS